MLSILLLLPTFKYVYLEEEFNKSPIMLQMMIKDFAFISRAVGVEPVCTRIFGKIGGDSGVHGDWRAADFRYITYGNPIYNDDQRAAVIAYMNAKWPRNDNYKACIFHSFTDTKGKRYPEHFHIQIPTLTINLRRY